MHRILPIALLCFAVTQSAASAQGSKWTPEKWEDGTTLRFQTTDPDQNEEWATVWYVVLHGDVYARLGASEADMIDNNIKRPYVRVRIGGQEFRDVRADPAPGMAETVADEIAYKYPMDFLFRYLPHPMTVRLRAASF